MRPQGGTDGQGLCALPRPSKVQDRGVHFDRTLACLEGRQRSEGVGSMSLVVRMGGGKWGPEAMPAAR